MKNTRLIPFLLLLSLAKILIIPGYVNGLLSLVTQTGLKYNFWWPVSAIGLILSLSCLVLVLLNLFRKKQPLPTARRQTTFSLIILGMSLGIGIFSSIVALYALNSLTGILDTSNETWVEKQLGQARLLNVIAVILVGVQWLAIALFIGSIHQAG